MSNRPFLPEPIRQVLADIYQCLQSAHLEELVMNVGLICSLYLGDIFSSPQRSWEDNLAGDLL
jgi:hypothetical protein